MRVLLWAGVLCVYPLLAHYVVMQGRLDLAAVLLILLVAFIAICLPGKAKWPLLASLPLLVLLYILRPEWLLYTMPVLINLLLCFLFGRTLRAGAEPFISRIARLERGELPLELAVYTRRLTWMWAVFFALMALACFYLAVFAPLALWSLFTNLVIYLLVGLLFFGEFAYRRLRYRHYLHASPLQVIGRIFADAQEQKPRN